MPSFSLKWMLAGVAFVALGCAALLNSSPTWTHLMYAVALLLLLSAPILAVYRRGAACAFWIGFATFGWGYFALSATEQHVAPRGQIPTTVVLDCAFEPMARYSLTQSGEFPSDWQTEVAKLEADVDKAQAEYRAAVALRNEDVQKQVQRQARDSEAFTRHREARQERARAVGALRAVQRRWQRALDARREEFMSIGHSLCTVMLAIIGGGIGRFAFATREKGE